MKYLVSLMKSETLFNLNKNKSRITNKYILVECRNRINISKMQNSPSIYYYVLSITHCLSESVRTYL